MIYLKVNSNGTPKTDISGFIPYPNLVIGLGIPKIEFGSFTAYANVGA